MSSLKALPFVFILGLILSYPSMARALPSEITHRLSPIEGVIVLPVDGEYLIDLDASKGIAEGDIFSVITPGPAVVHPVTGEVIGSLDKVEGWLEVTRTRNGYSYTRPLNPEFHFDKKTKIQRFTNLTAVFWDYTGTGEKVFTQLRAALPQLEWHTYLLDQAQRPKVPNTVTSDKPALTFIFQEGQLQIKGLNSRLLGQYPLATTVATPAPTAMHLPAVTAPLSVPAAPVSDGALIKTATLEPTGSIIRNKTQDSADIWSSAVMAGNPVGIEVADFDADGMNEIAILHKKSLEIGQFTGKEYRIIQKIPFKNIDKAATISSFDLNGDSRPELFISAMDGLEVNSLVVSFKDGSYQIIQNHLPWFLRAIQNPDGSKTVVGQRLGNKVDIFAPKINKIEFRNDRYASMGEYPHPWKTNVFALQPMTELENKTGYAAISENNRLRFYSAGNKILWESSALYGGGMVSIPLDATLGGGDQAETFIYLKPRLTLMDSTTLLAPQNDGWTGSFSFQSVGPGRLSALHWNGESMVELWHTAPQPGSLVDFQYADIDNDQNPEVVLLLLFKRSGLFSEGKAGLKIFEIN